MQFKTEDLPFAAFLACSKSLDFVGCERNDHGRISFVFNDPENRGERLWLAYETGATAPVNAFYAAIRALRQAMDNVTGVPRKDRRYVEHRFDGRAHREPY